MKISGMAAAAACVALLMTGAAQAGGDAAAGETKAKKCAVCHGAKGEGKKKNPPIAGMEEAVFVKKMSDYKSGAIKNIMMKMAVKKLGEEDFANLAAYFHVLK